MKVIFQNVLIQSNWHAAYALIHNERFVMNNIPDSSPNPPYNTISFEIFPTGMQYDENSMQMPIVFQRLDEKNQIHYHLCNVGWKSEDIAVVTPLQELVLNIPANPPERVEVDDSIIQKYMDPDLFDSIKEDEEYPTPIQSKAPKRVELPFFPVQPPDEDEITDSIKKGYTIEAKKTPSGKLAFRRIELIKPLDVFQIIQVFETIDSGGKSHYYLIQATDTNEDPIIISSFGVELTPETHNLKILPSGLPEVDFKSIEKYTIAVLKNPRPS
jgi:hypothetical protein